MLNRITLRQLFLILPIHFLTVLFGVFLLKLFLPTKLAIHATESIAYSTDNPFIIDFIREIFVNALYTVGVLVLPELFKLNHVPKKFINFILYPLFSFGVDSRGTGSAFGPNVVYALSCLSSKAEVSIRVFCHVFGPIFGGIIGGLIMSTMFPDDDSLHAS